MTIYKAPPDHCHRKRHRDTDINQHCHHKNHCLHNVITDTFLIHSFKDVPSVLVGKIVAHIVSNSESNNEFEALRSSLTDDKKILEYLISLPCLACNKNGEKRKGRKEKEKKIL